MKKYTLILIVITFITSFNFAGNPDRQGEAGAYELLLNPWARSVGLNLMNASYVRGVEAMNLNVAGLGRINRFEVGVGYSAYLQGTGLAVNGLGVATKIGENGTLGVNINALTFGKIPVTTNNLPEGTGATFSPTFFNVGLAYSYVFAKKVSIGIIARFLNESVADISASGFSLDAGVQYHTGSEQYPDRFKFGISLRNIGTPMRFGGQGLNFQTTNPDGTQPYQLTYSKQAAKFELPSQLNISAAYDVLPSDKSKLTLVGNFTSNAFTRDEAGAGLEFTFNQLFAIRGGYKYELGSSPSDVNRSIQTGVSGGVSLLIPMGKEKDRSISIDYGYVNTRVWDGTHNVALRITL
jgi:hypothetical protein